MKRRKKPAAKPRKQPAPDNNASHLDQKVLLEHWTTFRGRPLELHVTTVDATNHDSVLVRVRYGGSQTKVIVVAEDSTSRAGGEASVAVETPACPTARTTAQCENSDPREAEDTTPHLVGESDRLDKVNIASVDEERLDPTLSREVERGGVATCASSLGHDGPAPLSAAMEDIDADTYTEHTKTSSSHSREDEKSGSSAGDSPREGVIEAVEQTIRSSQSGQEQQHLALTAVERPEKTVKSSDECQEKEAGFLDQVTKETLPEENTPGKPVTLAVEHSEAMTSKAADKTTTPVPTVKGDGHAVCSACNQPCHPTSSPELLKATSAEDGTSSVLIVVFAGKIILSEEVFQHILSLLTWQDIVNVRRVSRSWRHAVDLHFAQRTELHIGRHDPPVVLDDNAFENLLRAMAALKRLSVEWREDGKKLDVDIVTRHCRQLVELDLTRFRLDAWSLEQLCVACPDLEIVKLPWKNDDSCAGVLMRNLPRLRSLDLGHAEVKVGTYRELSERPSLALCDFAISHGTLHGDDLLAILTKCPQLKRLSLAYSLISSSSDLRQLDQGQTVLGLRELDVTSVQGLTTTDLVAILSCSPQLECLWASRLYDMDLATCLMKLSECAELRELDVTRSFCSESETSPETLTALLWRCRKLERLALAGCNFTNSASLRELAQCPKLRELDLGVREIDFLGRLHGQVIDAADLKHGLSDCPLLERLSVTTLTAPLEQVVPPSGLPFLTYLYAGGKVLTSNSLRRLPGLFPRLHTLIIRECTSVSEDSLVSYLPRLQNLRSLELENVNGVTNALLEKLKERRLSHLRIDGQECA